MFMPPKAQFLIKLPDLLQSLRKNIKTFAEVRELNIYRAYNLSRAAF